ncbi:MAG: DNA-binding protein [Candidatus Woesearchaeota archaeon]|jgi:uncharacterized protein (UPF0332 family)
MAFNWPDYITLAKRLNTSSSTECEVRSATSRAYYGAFCFCRNKKGLNTDRSHDIHNKIITTYKESDNQCEYTIGNTLATLRKKRNDADYDGLCKHTWQQTNIDIKNAESIINLWARIDAEDCD